MQQGIQKNEPTPLIYLNNFQRGVEWLCGKPSPWRVAGIKSSSALLASDCSAAQLFGNLNAGVSINFIRFYVIW
jgi:hypothetical protein